MTKLTPVDQTDYSDFLIIPSSDTVRNPLRVNLRGKGRAYNVNINEIKTDGCGINPKVLNVLISVTDSSGTPIDALTDSNFMNYEDGIQKAITNLAHPIVNSPVSVTLMLDYSLSLAVSDRLAMEAAAKSFISLLQPNVDEASVIKFALTIGATTPNNDRRAIIVLSDGYDEESAITLNAVIARSIEKGIPVFTITYMNSFMPKPEIMQQLAQSTGGEAFEASTSADMQAIYSKISTILSHQYLIEYNTSSTGGATVSVNVKISDNLSLGENTKVATGCP